MKSIYNIEEWHLHLDVNIYLQYDISLNDLSHSYLLGILLTPRVCSILKFPNSELPFGTVVDLSSRDHLRDERSVEVAACIHEVNRA